MLAREKTGKHSFTKAVCEPGYQTNDIVGRNWKWLGTEQTQVVNSVNVRQFLSRNMGNRREHYSRTCGEPEEVINVEKRNNLARVHVSLESGSDVLQAGKRQALRHAKIVLVGMTADTARSRPKVRLLALFVASMGRKAPYRPNEPERGEGRQPVKPRARIRLQMHLAFL